MELPQPSLMKSAGEISKVFSLVASAVLFCFGVFVAVQVYVLPALDGCDKSVVQCLVDVVE